MHALRHTLPRLQAVAGEACTLMWALMDHDAQLMEDFMHTNLDAPGLPPTSCAIAQPAIMVRPPSRRFPTAGFP